MKKYILVLITMLVVISAVGCAESDNKGKDSNVSSAETSSEGQASLQQPSQITEASSSGQDNLQQPAETTTATKPVYDDSLWINVVATGASSDGNLITDMNNIGYACSNAETVGMTQIGIYAGNLYESTNAALQRSNSCSVSPELQPTKDEYNQGLKDINMAARLIIGAVDSYDTGDADTCISSMKMAKTYIDSGGQRFTTSTSLLKTYNENHGVN